MFFNLDKYVEYKTEALEADGWQRCQWAGRQLTVKKGTEMVEVTFNKKGQILSVAGRYKNALNFNTYWGADSYQAANFEAYFKKL